MISVQDLIKWCGEHAIGRSFTYPDGWIQASDLRLLAMQIEREEPLAFRYSLESNMPRKDCESDGETV